MPGLPVIGIVSMVNFESVYDASFSVFSSVPERHGLLNFQRNYF